MSRHLETVGTQQRAPEIDEKPGRDGQPKDDVKHDAPHIRSTARTAMAKAANAAVAIAR
jgi:hypothetical protein